jgi:predicted transcriptional regulator
MEVNFTPEIEAKLSHIAAQQGRNPADVVEELLARYFDDEARFAEAVVLGEEALRRGEYLTHEQAGERLQRFLCP